MHLLRKCPCPVWLTRPAEKDNYRCILAAVDFNLDQDADRQERTLNQQILEFADSLALSDFAELHFVHVWDAPAEMLIKRWVGDTDEESLSYVNSERACHEKAFDHFRYQLRNSIGEEAYNHLSAQFHLRRGTPSTDIPEIKSCSKQPPLHLPQCPRSAAYFFLAFLKTKKGSKPQGRHTLPFIPGPPHSNIITDSTRACSF